jgi:transcriptional regulator with XRE-family HTH domain
VRSKRALAFGRWLRRRRREDLRIGLREMVHRAGLSIGQLSELERGYYDGAALSVTNFVKISTGYRVQITALLARLGLAPYADGSMETLEIRPKEIPSK